MNYCYLNDYELVNNELNNTLKCEFLEPQILKSVGSFVLDMIKEPYYSIIFVYKKLYF